MNLSVRNATMGVIVAATLGVLAGAWWTRHAAHSATATVTATTTAGNAHRVLYWYDPMSPGQHFDQPGKSPYMDMQLVPRYADDADNAATGARIDARLTQNLGVRLATVESRAIAPSLDVPGTVRFNGRDMAIVQARAAGFVTRVYAHAPGDRVARGAPLVDLMLPDWAAAQSEFLALLEHGDAALSAAARQRLALLGMPAELIGRLEQSRQVHAEVSVAAPLAGAIDTLDARTGMTVNAGTTLATIRGTDPIWVEAAIPESMAQSLTTGATVTVHSPAFPAASFRAHVTAVLPETAADTHTLRVRIELPNRNGQWKPGMFATVAYSGAPQRALLVPAEAVIHTGSRDLVIVAAADHRYQTVEVHVGAQYDGQTAVLGGLSAGQRVVASGQFLIDSEAYLRGAIARMSQPQTGTEQ